MNTPAEWGAVLVLIWVVLMAVAVCGWSKFAGRRKRIEDNIKRTSPTNDRSGFQARINDEIHAATLRTIRFDDDRRADR